MASTTWYIQGIDTDGRDLVLSQIQPWSASGEETPLSITSTFPPTSGALSDLLIADNTECVFAAADVQNPGFAIEITFSDPVDLWGFRFAGPSPDTWPLQHMIAAGVQACSVGRVAWSAGVLSPSPTRRPVFSQQTGAWAAQTDAGARPWLSCAVSADGQVLLAAASSSNLWLSKDGGTTWVAQVDAGVRTWRDCAVSADGQVLLATTYSSNLWLSKDGGATWVEQIAAGVRNWRDCAVSADGQVLLAGTYLENLWLSTDGGATWAEQTATGVRTWQGCAVSADGQVLLAGAYNSSNLWLSKDGGTTWVEQVDAGARSWIDCAVSADGQVLLATAYSSYLRLSKDGGTTWVAQVAAGARNWEGCATSADGQVLLAGTYLENLWLSKDGGTTWVEQIAAGARSWEGCATSADGQVLLAASSGNLWVFCESDPIYLPNTPRTYTPHAVLAVQGLPPDPQGTLNTYAAEAVQFNDFEFSGNGRVYGTVERKNTPANVPLRRRVRLHRSRDGMLVRETWSKPDGSYEFKHVSMHYEYDAIAWDHEMSYRSVIANNLKPEAM